MNYAYVAAIVSAVTMTAVYLTDMIMAGKTYDRPSQPMFVSSLFSVIPGAMLLVWCEGNAPPIACLMAFGAGAALMVANWLYFTVLYSDSGELTEVSSFESASVLVIALVTVIMRLAGVTLHDAITPLQWTGVYMGIAGLFSVHLFGDKLELVDWPHRMRLVGFMLFGAAYEMAIDRAIYLASLPLNGSVQSEQHAFLEVSPYFWFGLATGMVALLLKAERTAWRENLPNLKQYWWTVVIVEGLAIIAFAAMVFGFAGGHVAVIALLAGCFPILVMIGGVVCRRQFGVDEETFPIIQHPAKKTAAVIIVVIGAALASS